MEEHEYDVVIVGTSLTESILAAALSKAGINVLHIDPAPNYGGRDAVLTFKDLLSFVDKPPRHIRNVEVVPGPTDDLVQNSREYSISLAPSLVPSVGPLIDSLIKSGVAKYGTFKLLETVGIYQHEGRVNTVPSSKEDVFKNTSLSLVEKRKLMKFLLFAAGEFEESEVVKGMNGSPTFMELLTGPSFGLGPEISRAIAFALAHCANEKDEALSSLTRLRRYIRSTGRYGNSPFLVGHYGGAGELVQGFCRVCAVSGGTYILGREYQISQSPDGRIEIEVEEVKEKLTARLLVAENDSLPENWSPKPVASPSRSISRCIAIVEGSISFNTPQPNEDVEDSESSENKIDTALLVFPPGSIPESPCSNTSVSVLITGESSMSCPKGQYILYISAETPPSNITSQEALKPYLKAMLTLPSTELTPLYTVYYNETLTTTTPSTPDLDQPNHVSLNRPSVRLSEFSDETAAEAERVFWHVIEKLGLKRGSPSNKDEDEEDDEDVIPSFWPPAILSTELEDD